MTSKKIMQVLTNSYTATWPNLQIQIVGSLTELRQDLQKSQGFVVSDGSFRDKAGTAAWSIKGNTA